MLAIGGGDSFGRRQVDDSLSPRQLLPDRDRRDTREPGIRRPDNPTSAPGDLGGGDHRDRIGADLGPLEHRVFAHDRAERAFVDDGEHGEHRAPDRRHD